MWLHQIIALDNNKIFSPCFCFFFFFQLLFHHSFTSLPPIPPHHDTSSPINRPIQLHLERQSLSGPLPVNMNTVHSVRVAATSLFNTGPCLSQFPPRPITAARESSGAIATARAAVVIGRVNRVQRERRRKSS